jgi:hypothetical protein
MRYRRYICHDSSEDDRCDAGACKMFDKCRYEDNDVCLLKERDEALAENMMEARREDRELVI